jgi:hypothetical protein
MGFNLAFNGVKERKKNHPKGQADPDNQLPNKWSSAVITIRIYIPY